MNNMKLAPPHRECPGVAQGNLAVEFVYISHLLCAQICEMEALVKRVKRNDPTVKQHDLKMARLLPLKVLYIMLPRIDELAPHMPMNHQQTVRRHEVGFLPCHGICRKLTDILGRYPSLCLRLDYLGGYD
jgi:hypothetical protein